jgi:hypothetical protein
VVVERVLARVAEVVRLEEGLERERERERRLREGALAEGWQTAAGTEPGAMVAKYAGLDQEKTREK